MAKKTSRISAIVFATLNGKSQDVNLLIDLTRKVQKDGKEVETGGTMPDSWGTWDSFQCYISVSLRGKAAMYAKQMALLEEGSAEYNKAKESRDEIIAIARLKYWSFIKEYLNERFPQWVSREANGALDAVCGEIDGEPKLLIEGQTVSSNLLEEFAKGTKAEQKALEAYNKQKK